MKNLQLKKSNQNAFLLTLGFLMIILTSSQSSFASTTQSRKMVLYQGEWITRVDMPEVTIEANRIKNNKILLKNVETVYYRGIKTLHVTIEDIVIPSTGNANVTSELIDATEFESEQNLSSLNSQLLASSSIKSETIFADGTYYASSKENEENVPVNAKSELEITKAKKPIFNRIINTIFDAGFNFLKKVNDGLFFKS